MPGTCLEGTILQNAPGVFRSTPSIKICVSLSCFWSLLGQLGCTSAKQSSLLKTPSLIAIELYLIANNFNVINAGLSLQAVMHVYQGLI